MALIRLRINNLRVIHEAELLLGERLNVIVGPNASGKTSVLEAIYLLGLGRSFRSSRLDELISKDTSSGLTVFGETSSEGRVKHFGFGRKSGESRCQIDTRACSRRELADGLAIQNISPESHHSFLHSSKERRSLLDWVVFHVEHEFYERWQTYQRALKQRNALLRSKGGIEKELTPWNVQLHETAKRLTSLREKYLEELAENTRALLASYFADAKLQEISVGLKRGWAKDKNLGEILSKDWETDRERGHTQTGPHRADLSIRLNGEPPSQTASHGQQKLLVIALRLAATAIVKKLKPGTSIIVLLDDLAAELDDQNQGRVLRLLSGLGIQVVATIPVAGLIDTSLMSGSKMFHVEHGIFRPVD